VKHETVQGILRDVRGTAVTPLEVEAFVRLMDVDQGWAL
jgi:hypothetical protein